MFSFYKAALLVQVELQRKMFEQYEQRERQRKVRFTDSGCRPHRRAVCVRWGKHELWAGTSSQ